MAHARLRREHQMRVSRKRVLRLMRDHQLLAPQRTSGRRKRKPPYDGTIVPDAPDVMWGTDAAIDRFGTLDADVARGISLRHDWGPRYRSVHFTGSIRWLGLDDSPAYVGEPETNGCVERFIRTLKEPCLSAKAYATIGELRQAVAECTHQYNTEWLIERHGHRTPREARAAAMTATQAA